MQRDTLVPHLKEANDIKLIREKVESFENQTDMLLTNLSTQITSLNSEKGSSLSGTSSKHTSGGSKKKSSKLSSSGSSSKSGSSLEEEATLLATKVAAMRVEAQYAEQEEQQRLEDARRKAEADAEEARRKAEADAQEARRKAEADAQAAQRKAEAEARAAQRKAEAEARAATLEKRKQYDIAAAQLSVLQSSINDAEVVSPPASISPIPSVTRVSPPRIQDTDKPKRTAVSFEKLQLPLKQNQTSNESTPPEVSTTQVNTAPKTVNELKPTAPVFVPTLSSTQISTSESTGMIKAVIESNQALVDQQELNRLPVAKPDIFKGDPLKYHSWKCAFDILIDKKALNESAKIYHLKQYLGGSALECVNGFFECNDVNAYKRARELLEKRFGAKHSIATAFLDR